MTDPTLLADSLYLRCAMQARLGDTAGYRATCETIVKLPISEISASVGAKFRPISTPRASPGASKIRVCR